MIKLSFAKKQWMPAIQIVANAVDKKQLLPILSSILVSGSKGYISLTATDLEVELTSFIPFKEAEFIIPFTLPSKKFMEILRTIDDEELVVIEADNDALFINSGLSKFKFATLKADNFPIIELIKWTQSLEIPRLTLLHLLNNTLFAVSQQDVRVYLKGLLFECNNNQLTAVGADGHRMAISKVELPLSCAKEKLVIPRKGVYELLRLLNLVSCETININIHPTLFQAVTPDFVFTSKLIDVQYLPYQQAIPKKNNTFVLVDIETFKRALARILIIAYDKSRPVVFVVQDKGLAFLGQNLDQEEVNEYIEATVDGPGLRIGINPVYLLEVLNIIKSAVVRLSFFSADTPILIEPLDDELYQHIIMPVKI